MSHRGEGQAVASGRPCGTETFPKRFSVASDGEQSRAKQNKQTKNPTTADSMDYEAGNKKDLLQNESALARQHEKGVKIWSCFAFSGLSHFKAIAGKGKTLR